MPVPLLADNCYFCTVMTLEQQIQEDIKAAMKAHDAVAMAAVRAVKNEILLFKTAEGGSKDVTDADVLKMIQKLIKQRRETIGGAPFDAEQHFPGFYTTPGRYNRFDVIYLSCGEEDGRIDGMRDFRQKMEKAGYKGIVWEQYPGNHEWKVWRRNLASFVQLLFK